jgi:Site-specific recombinase XerD
MGSRQSSLAKREGDKAMMLGESSSLVLDGISSPHTRRAYSQALEEFLIWFRDEPEREFNKAAVQKYRAELEIKGLAPSSINVRLSAIRRLALEAADNGVMAPELAAGVARARGAKRGGVRLGHWLTVEQAEQFLALPDLKTLKGNRDGAVLAILLGAGLRRSELTSLDCEHLQERDGRWVIVDLAGKMGRIRSVPIPCGRTPPSPAGKMRLASLRELFSEVSRATGTSRDGQYNFSHDSPFDARRARSRCVRRCFRIRRPRDRFLGLQYSRFRCV